MTAGVVARLKAQLQQRADMSEALAGSWTTLSAGELARRSVFLERDGRAPLGDLFTLTGEPQGRIRFIGDLKLANRLGAGMSEGEVTVEGNLGSEAGLAMAGGTLDIDGDAGPHAGAAPPGFKRGMTGGELIVRGSAGPGAGTGMRRGLMVVAGKLGEGAGAGMIAGSIIVFGSAGPDVGIWSKRGSVVALGPITIPPAYSYACTYQPVHLRLLFTWLRIRYGLPVRPRHLSGLYRRYSGDMAELGKGEILVWTGR